MSVTTAKRKEGGIAETVRVIFHALIIALVIRTFLFQPFNIPSGSMKETLLVGDYLFVSKFTYGYSHYSLPFSPPVFNGRIWASEPNRRIIAAGLVKNAYCTIGPAGKASSVPQPEPQTSAASAPAVTAARHARPARLSLPSVCSASVRMR